MNIQTIATGKQVPTDVNLIIEIPAQSDPVKYEVDKESGALRVDRFISTGMRYPCNYGYIPNTLSEDGDPVDGLVITPFPVTYGAVIRVRPIGILHMEDESGIDGKILAVPVDKLSSQYKHIQEIQDVDSLLIAQIEHFFQHYKALEPGKWVRIQGWGDVLAAHHEILEGIKRHNLIHMNETQA